MAFAAFSASQLWAPLSNSKTVAQAVNVAKLILARSRVPEPAASAEYLAVSAFDSVRTRRAACTTLEKPALAELDIYASLCRQRQEAHVPIQYLVGEWDFHNITLRVRPPVLIPRPETEELVEHFLKDVRQDNADILDVGCGSGAIMLAVLSAKPTWKATGIDISKDAVTLTKENMRNLHLEGRGTVVPTCVENYHPQCMFDALISNPPYIPRKDISGLERQVRQHEDFQALCGGEDGLDVIRDILAHAPRLVRKGGTVWMEVEHSQPDTLESLKVPGLQFIGRYNDLSGNPRFCNWSVVEQDLE